MDESKEDTGGIGGFFASLFGMDDDDETRRRRDNYTTVAARHSVVTVHTVDAEEAERAADILDDAGAIDVDEQAEQYRGGTHAGYNTPVADRLTSAPSGSTGVAMLGDDMTDTKNWMITSDDQATNGDQTIEVIEENMEVGKRTVETGGVNLRSRIVECPVEESVRLREERVQVVRNPVNRTATTADLDAFKESQFELVEHAEVADVSKTANVVEAISINKAVTERNETIRDTVRRKEVDVEQIPGTTTRTTTTTDRDRDRL